MNEIKRAMCRTDAKILDVQENLVENFKLANIKFGP